MESFQEIPGLPINKNAQQGSGRILELIFSSIGFYFMEVTRRINRKLTKIDKVIWINPSDATVNELLSISMCKRSPLVKSLFVLVVHHGTVDRLKVKLIIRKLWRR